jgi:hypothetical protein
MCVAALLALTPGFAIPTLAQGQNGQAQNGQGTAPQGAARGRNTVPTDLPGLSTEVAKVETLLANQSHVMADVAFQFSNLWFAGERKNWPLAQFFYNETRNRVRWMIRINPIVQDPDKRDVDLQGIFDAIDKDVWSLIKTAIDKKDPAQFEAAYKLGLDKGCYSCHKSVGRPYLRPQVPTQMPQTIITFDPNAKWPE